MEAVSVWELVGGVLLEENDVGAVAHIQFEGRPTAKIWWLAPMPDRLAAKVYRDDFTLLGRILDGSD